MLIGVDLDGTFAADITTFRKVVTLFHSAGHQCVLVTNRGPEDARVVEGLVEGLMPIIYANGVPKRDAALAGGFDIHIWIDDNPVLVDFGAPGLALVSKVR